MDKKQVIVMRKDLNMRKGKMIAQGSHASMAALLLFAQKEKHNLILDLTNEQMGPWLSGSFKKVVVSVSSLEELDKIYQQAKENKIICSYIIDNGLTEFNGEKTPTCICLGPHESKEIDKITGKLPLL